MEADGKIFHKVILILYSLPPIHLIPYIKGISDHLSVWKWSPLQVASGHKCRAQNLKPHKRDYTFKYSDRGSHLGSGCGGLIGPGRLLEALQSGFIWPWRDPQGSCKALKALLGPPTALRSP